MKLTKVATFFNDTPYSDSYSGEVLGKGQLDVFDDSKRDGLTVLRRIFEVAPNSPMPTRGVINFLGMDWIVGIKEIDQFRGKVIRNKYVCHKSEGLANIHNYEGLLNDNLPDLVAHASQVWVKSAAEVEMDSDKFDQVNLFLARGEPVTSKMLVELNGRWFISREDYPSSAGFLVLSAEELDSPPKVQATITRTDIDPVTEIPTEVTQTIPLLVLRWQTDFKYYSQDTPDFERGDIQAVGKVKLANNTLVTLNGEQWRVVNSQSHTSLHYHHMRRA